LPTRATHGVVIARSATATVLSATRACNHFAVTVFALARAGSDRDEASNEKHAS
jgi:hypothetical protein